MPSPTDEVSTSLTDDVPLGALYAVLATLIFLSAFFSGSETALMSLNRYRLRHKARAGHRGARLAEALLRQPDRLIGLILLGNNLVNISATVLATLIAIRAGISAGMVVLILTLVVLIFAETAPKTLAALHPERLAYPAAYVYSPLLKVLYPFVWLINVLSNGVLKILGLGSKVSDPHTLSREELRTVVLEAGALLPKRRQSMLLSILDLENVTVDDLMVPRNDVVGIDLNDNWEDIVEVLRNSQHTRLPVYRDELENIIGILHIRRVLQDLSHDRLTVESLEELAQEPYFIPEGTPLNKQLMNFQRAHKRLGLVVDEYGDIQGLVTLEDILREIVGELSSDAKVVHKDIIPDDQGYLVKGNITLRALNRMMRWSLPTDGPKTLSGLIIETMETIPEPGTSLEVAGYPIEIVRISDNTVKTARISAETGGSS